MISKKSRKVVAALLIGATVCASGTFAYFNAKTNLDSIEGLADDAQKTLNITNGKIEITGKIAGIGDTDASSLWGYDVARVSTLKQMEDTAFAGLMADYGLTAASTMAMTSTYISANQSPDILGLADDEAALNTAAGELQTALDNWNALKANQTATESEKTAAKAAYDAKLAAYNTAKVGVRSAKNRAAIGEAVAAEIVNARPGDAFVLGGAGNVTGDITTAGITIDNKSNLTTKIGIRLNKGNDDGAATKAQLDAMNANGWKVYIKVTNPLDSDAGIVPFAEWTEVDSTTFGTLADDDLTCLVSTVAPGQAAPTIQMRVELPLTRVNDYQEKQTGDGVVGSTDFDLTNLFEIVATQENNPGWNEDGSKSNPITTDAADTTK